MPRAKKTEQWEANSTIEKENIVHKDGMPKSEHKKMTPEKKEHKAIKKAEIKKEEKLEHHIKQKPAWTIKGSEAAKSKMSELRAMKKQKKEQK